MPTDKDQPKRIKRTTGDRSGAQRAAVRPHKRETASGSTSQAHASTSTNQTHASSSSATSHATASAPASSAASSTSATQRTFDLNAIIAKWASGLTSGSVHQTYAGSALSRKESAARQQFAVPAKDQLFLVLDATIFGTCKAGLALASTGVYLRDTAGKQRAIAWGDLPRCKVAADSQTLVIDGSKIVTLDGSVLASLLVAIQKQIAG